MNLLPSESLTSVSNFQTAELVSAAAVLSTLEVRQARMSKQVSYTNTVQGRQTIEMTERKATENAAADSAAGAESTASLAQTLADGGQDSYDENSLAPGTSSDPASIEALNAEVGGVFEGSAEASSPSPALEAETSLLESKIAESRQKIDNIKEDILSIDSVLENRANGLLPEPKLNTSGVSQALDNIIAELSTNLTEEEKTTLKESLVQTASQSMEAFDKFVENALIKPYTENKSRINAIPAQIYKRPVEKEKEPIFDLVYGPPVASTDRFVLSEDGIYYDSREGGIPSIFMKKITADFWKHEFGPNRGGKGLTYSDAEFDKFADTIFSDSFAETSPKVENFYKYDDILTSLRKDKELELMDVSSTIEDLVASGYSSDSAMVMNYLESYGAVPHSYETQIKVREKQLQLAAIFGPFIVTDETHPLGPGHFFEESLPLNIGGMLSPLCGTDRAGNINFDEGIGDTNTKHSEVNNPKVSDHLILTSLERIPVNDFSYLKRSALVPSIDVQERFTLLSSDLDDVIKPMTPKYVTAPEKGISIIPSFAIPTLAEMDGLTPPGITLSRERHPTSGA